MKKAAKVMYIISLVFAIIALVFGVITLASGIFALVNPEAFKNAGQAISSSDAAVALGWGIYMIVAEIIGIIFLKWAKKSVGTSNVVPHIVAIVIGVISGNLFLLLGGIFGALSSKQ